jgi:hypothetical protein
VTEQQRADGARTGLVHAVASDNTIGGALIFDLDQHPLAGLVAQVEPLGDKPVELGAFELVEPVAGEVVVLCRRREVRRRQPADEASPDVRRWTRLAAVFPQRCCR